MKCKPFLYRSWAEISTEQIIKNYKAYKSHIGNKSKIIAVVKANAYGHGDVRVSRALEDAGVNFFAVSNVFEAVRLREGGIRGNILILGYTPVSHLHLLAEHSLIGTVVSERHVSELVAHAPKNAEFHIAIDTGMHRIGLDLDDLENTKNIIENAAKTLNITGMFTHLSVADSSSAEDNYFTEEAVYKFGSICREREGLGINNVHCLNSAGGLRYFNELFNTVRLGISLYGYSPSEDVDLPEEILPVLEWKTAVASVFKIKAGESVGYGRSFTAKRDMLIATLMTGYADGYPRALSGKGKVIINGKFASVVGRVCMDMMMVDVTDIEGVRAGDTATLIGCSGDKTVTADDLGREADTISYEILTGISERVERIYT